MKPNIRVRALLCLMLSLLLVIPARIFAQGDETAASLTVSCLENETPIVGAVFDIYMVAAPTDGKYLLTGDFEKVAVSLEKTDAESLSALASTLDIYADLYSIAPSATQTTNQDGDAFFGGLMQGLYLVVGRDYPKDGKKYVNTPFVVFLPELDEKGEKIFDVTVLPKFSTEPERPAEEVTVCKALKVWQSDSKNDRPASITVYLLRDGRIHDTVTLNSANNWRYSWTDLDSAYKWTVAEKVPDGYTVTVQKEGITYLVTNSGDTTPPDGGDEDDDKDKPKPGTSLPQTGQLWWPVPVLLVLGLTLIIIGCIRRRGDGYEA